MPVLVAELLGSAVMIIAVNNAGKGAESYQAVGVGMALFSLICLFGGISGGHFNPAVSFGVWIARGKLLSDLGFLCMIILGQLIGGLLAIGLAFLSLFAKFDDKFAIRTPAYACPVDVNDATKACDGADGNGFHYNF